MLIFLLFNDDKLFSLPLHDRSHRSPISIARRLLSPIGYIFQSIWNKECQGQYTAACQSEKGIDKGKYSSVSFSRTQWLTEAVSFSFLLLSKTWHVFVFPINSIQLSTSNKSVLLRSKSIWIWSYCSRHLPVFRLLSEPARCNSSCNYFCSGVRLLFPIDPAVVTCPTKVSVCSSC